MAYQVLSYRIKILFGTIYNIKKVKILMTIFKYNIKILTLVLLAIIISSHDPILTKIIFTQKKKIVYDGKQSFLLSLKTFTFESLYLHHQQVYLKIVFCTVRI